VAGPKIKIDCNEENKLKKQYFKESVVACMEML
jgi:hypothetical protein